MAYPAFPFIAGPLNLGGTGSFDPTQPGPIGGTTPGTGTFTTISATGAITSTLATGTAPFTVASTTVVANLNSTQWNGLTNAGGATGRFMSFTSATNVAGSTQITASGTAATIGTIGGTYTGVVLAGAQTALAAVAGQVGEVIESKISTATSAAGTGAYLQLATISLTAGDWLISASAIAIPNGATFAVGGALEALIGTTTASNTGTTAGYDRMIDGQPVIAGVNVSMAIPAKRVLINATTSYFLNVLQTYSAGTPQWQGSITATRIR